jgi:membrane protein implicated in regulation of membrane protease activity
MITCPWCGTQYAKFQPNCKNCGGSLPHPPAPEAAALPAPPPPPRQVPGGYARRILFTQATGIVGLVFAILGAVFFPLGLALSLAVVTLAVGLPFLVLGVAFLAVAWLLLGSRYRKAQATVEILRSGQAALGEITQVYENLHIQVNGRFPWTIGYRFEVHGHGYAGRVTTLSRPGLAEQPGKPVYVLYRADDPGQNTIYPNPYGYYGF